MNLEGFRHYRLSKQDSFAFVSCHSFQSAQMVDVNDARTNTFVKEGVEW